MTARSAECLLINPTITSQRNARFPLAVLSLSRGAGGPIRPGVSSTATSIAISSRPRCASSAETASRAVGVTVMGGPQLRLGDRRVEGDSASATRPCRSSGAGRSRPFVRKRH